MSNMAKLRKEIAEINVRTEELLRFSKEKITFLRQSKDRKCPIKYDSALFGVQGGLRYEVGATSHIYFDKDGKADLQQKLLLFVGRALSKLTRINRKCKLYYVFQVWQELPPRKRPVSVLVTKLRAAPQPLMSQEVVRRRPPVSAARAILQILTEELENCVKRRFYQWLDWIRYRRRLLGRLFDRWNVKTSRLVLNRMNARRFVQLTARVAEKSRYFVLLQGWRQLYQQMNRCRYMKKTKLWFRAWCKVVQALKRGRKKQVKRMLLHWKITMCRERELDERYSGVLQRRHEKRLSDRAFYTWYQKITIKVALRKVLCFRASHCLPAFSTWKMRFFGRKPSTATTAMSQVQSPKRGGSALASPIRAPPRHNNGLVITSTSLTSPRSHSMAMSQSPYHRKRCLVCAVRSPGGSTLMESWDTFPTATSNGLANNANSEDYNTGAAGLSTSPQSVRSSFALLQDEGGGTDTPVTGGINDSERGPRGQQYMRSSRFWEEGGLDLHIPTAAAGGDKHTNTDNRRRNKHSTRSPSPIINHRPRKTTTPPVMATHRSSYQNQTTRTNKNNIPAGNRPHSRPSSVFAGRESRTTPPPFGNKPSRTATARAVPNVAASGRSRYTSNIYDPPPRNAWQQQVVTTPLISASPRYLKAGAAHNAAYNRYDDDDLKTPHAYVNTTFAASGDIIQGGLGSAQSSVGVGMDTFYYEEKHADSVIQHTATVARGDGGDGHRPHHRRRGQHTPAEGGGGGDGRVSVVPVGGALLATTGGEQVEMKTVERRDTSKDSRYSDQDEDHQQQQQQQQDWMTMTCVSVDGSFAVVSAMSRDSGGSNGEAFDQHGHQRRHRGPPDSSSESGLLDSGAAAGGAGLIINESSDAQGQRQHLRRRQPSAGAEEGSSSSVARQGLQLQLVYDSSDNSEYDNEEKEDRSRGSSTPIMDSRAAVAAAVALSYQQGSAAAISTGRELSEQPQAEEQEVGSSSKSKLLLLPPSGKNSTSNRTTNGTSGLAAGAGGTIIKAFPMIVDTDTDTLTLAGRGAGRGATSTTGAAGADIISIAMVNKVRGGRGKNALSSGQQWVGNKANNDEGHNNNHDDDDDNDDSVDVPSEHRHLGAPLLGGNNNSRPNVHRSNIDGSNIQGGNNTRMAKTGTTQRHYKLSAGRDSEVVGTVINTIEDIDLLPTVAPATENVAPAPFLAYRKIVAGMSEKDYEQKLRREKIFRKRLAMAKDLNEDYYERRDSIENLYLRSPFM